MILYKVLSFKELDCEENNKIDIYNQVRIYTEKVFMKLHNLKNKKEIDDFIEFSIYKKKYIIQRIEVFDDMRISVIK